MLKKEPVKVTEQTLSDQEFFNILEYISLSIGIVPIETHRDGIKKFVEERICELKKNGKIANNSAYLEYIFKDAEENQLLVDAATVNETYFFREQKQFELLKQKIIPELTIKKGQIKIWSAACSSGEEPYSLFLIAENLRVKTKITASDINNLALNKCRKGIYKKSSVKNFDGSTFNHLLNKFWHEKNEEFENGAFVFPESIKNQIEFKNLNLMNLCNPEKIEAFPKNQDIIFLRNVFIYFPRETKKKILSKIAENCLAEGGKLFVSMNETAGIDREILPECLERKCNDSVFYFQKKNLSKFLSEN